MNARSIVATCLCLLFCAQVMAEPQDIDVELSDLADKLAATVKAQGKKKVTVLDFTDLQGNPRGELGRYIAEQVTINLVSAKKDFSVLDRANLKAILAEHKLTATGLVDPENAKKLGMFAGVDALILGTIIPKSQTFALTVKIITTDTAEIVGAARAEFKADETVRTLATSPAPEARPGPGSDKTKAEPAATVRTFGDLRVELQPLQISKSDELLMSIVFTNRNPRRSVWVALNSETLGSIKSRISDPAGQEYKAVYSSISGIPVAWQQTVYYVMTKFAPAAEIKGREAIQATLKFVPTGRNPPEPGLYTVQLEFLIGRNFDGATSSVTTQNLLVKVQAQ